MSRLVRCAPARLAVGAGLAVLLLAVTLGLASPAGAQTDAGSPADGRGRSGITSLLRTLEAGRSPLARPAVEPAPLADARPDRGCVDAGPADADVPTMVAEIFRCRLDEAGVPWDQAREIAAEAIAVAHCESLFDTQAIVFDGRYRDQAHPRTGMRYSAAGVFQFIRKTADKWIEAGGYANVHAPRRNIDAAARLYIHNRNLGARGWEDWACAAVNDGFKQGGSVLPGWPGGPTALPDWVYNYLD